MKPIAFIDHQAQQNRIRSEIDIAIAALHIGGMDDDAQEQAERIDEDMALASRDLLARVIALRVERSSPFCAPLAL